MLLEVQLGQGRNQHVEYQLPPGPVPFRPHLCIGLLGLSVPEA